MMFRATRTLGAILLPWAGAAAAWPADAALERGFADPPAEARPWVLAVALDGNLSREGITADLEAMARVGLGGLVFYEVEQGTPPGPVRFGSPAWRETFRHLITEADRLDLRVNLHNAAGWTGSGGPWITPELAMQRVVWAETTLTGPRHFDGTLPQPAAVRGYYRDIALFAYPTPEQEFRIPRIRGRAGAPDTRMEVSLRTDYPEPAPAAVVPRAHLVNLTASLAPDGRLLWDVPEGRWTLVRLGATATGKENLPAPPEGRGLESDKLSKEATEHHFRALLGPLIRDNELLAGADRTLVSTHIDSWEVGAQNWTPEFQEEFRRRRAYDPLPLLPVLSGRVVDSLEISERFLRDWRQTVADLLGDNYVGHLRALAGAHGLRLSMEAYDQLPANDLVIAGRADEPMGEFWSWDRLRWAHTLRAMSSAAHVYGHPIVAAEAFTANRLEKWQGHPGNLKSLADLAFTEGVNRLVIHRYALQPWTRPERRPGLSMGPWGLHYERTQTWWEQSRPWHDYLARCQFMLRQGRPVADLCFLQPENTPQRFRSPVKSGAGPTSHDFDGCPPEALLERMSVQDGRLVLSEGQSYRLLVLPRVRTMTPALLRKVRDLVVGGATVLGLPPVKSPSLQDYPQCDAEVRALARELWGEGNPPAQLTARAVGRGRVIWGRELEWPEPPYAAPTDLETASWIWSGEGEAAASAPTGRRYFRRRFTIDRRSDLVSAQLAVVADDQFECWVNRNRSDSGRNRTLDVTTRLVPGENVIAVTALNRPGEPGQPNPAGLAAALTLKYRDGSSRIIRTDSAWEVTADLPDGWPTGTGGDWSATRVLGPVGMAPWGVIDQELEQEDPILDLALATRALELIGVPPDFQASAPLRWTHRQADGAEIYFISNQETRDLEAVCTFRAHAAAPELWWPDTARMETVADCTSVAEGTRFPLRIEAGGSVFVVFRPGTNATLPARSNASVAGPGAAQAITGPWTLAFPEGQGAPAMVRMDRLISLSEHPEAGVRYFSGTAVYRTTFTRTPQAAGTRMMLDLGRVEVMAQVRLNGHDLGLLWKPPYRVEATGALRDGENQLEIRVTNLWINRLIGDEHLPEDNPRREDGTLAAWPSWLLAGEPSPTGRVTFVSQRQWKKDDPLPASGLLGPVTLRASP